MKQIKWFDRKFDFSFEQNIFPSIVERLEATLLLLKNKTAKLPKENLRDQINGKWSIQENIGHLIDLEPIWQGRLEDILTDKSELRIADLTNKKTDLAKHNEKNIDDLLAEFHTIRTLTLHALYKLTENDIYKNAMHPRLKKPMRIMDLFLFVAEHDAHHLSSITKLKKSLTR